MLAKLELQLKSAEKITYQMSSLFHGALMELLPGEYAEYLHLSQLHPYTQHLEYREDKWYWIVTCLDKEAAQVIIRDTLWNQQYIEIRNHNVKIDVVHRKYEEMPYKELMNRFYEQDYTRYISIHFISPTAFKQKGKYVFYPDIHCIFQSLMNKYDAACGEENMFDYDTLTELCDHACITRYDLKSVNFSLEGVRIPSFIGKVTVRINGTQTMANFAHMLFEFGTYAGIGIKTSLGMGAIKILEGRKRK